MTNTEVKSYKLLAELIKKVEIIENHKRVTSKESNKVV